ncbi:MAG: alpha/beta fold hydrolase [Acidimicrobiales bacterium]
MRKDFDLRHVTIHGHRVGYRMAGKGPAVVLLHGLTGSSTTWREVMPALSRHFTVMAPDMLGHGQSAKPRGDYSLGAYASGVRDLMVALGIPRASLVGHSLGGGVAMQMAYQFPERCQRLALVASGGLGREVTVLLKLASLPGSEYILSVVLNNELHSLLEWVGSPLRRLGLRLGPTNKEIWRSYSGLTDRDGLDAFINTVRAVVDLGGQRVSASDRLYLASKVPTLIVWGDRDRVIPVEHAYRAHKAIPGSRLEIIEGAGHFLPFEEGERFLDILTQFLTGTTPARANDRAFRDALVSASGCTS